MKEDVLLEPTQVAPRSPGSLPDVNDVTQALTRASREKRRAARARTIAQVFALTAAALLVPALLDYRYFWSATERYAVSFGWWIVAILGLWHAVIEWRRPAQIKEVALEMERRRSLPRCEVSTAAQYAEKSVPGPDGIAGELNHALQRRAALHLRNTGSPYRPPFWIWSGLLALALVAGVPAWTLSPACRMATQRVVFPGMPAHYTTVEVRPGDCEIATKTDLEVTVQFGGRPPTDAQVERRDADGNWKADGLTQTGPRSFSYRFQDVRGDFTYRVRGNDALSPDYQVRTYTPPEMAAMEVEIVPPAYAQIPSARSIGGNVTALRGSELHWRLLSTVPLAKAGFHFKDGQPGLDLNAENPQSWLGSLTLQKNAAYRVALLDLKNRPGREGDEFHLVALPDAPPSVEISSPEPNITTGPQDKVTIQVRADDDIGLAGVDLVSQKPGSPKQTVPIVSGDKLGRHVKGSIVLDLAPLNLKPYDVVMFYAEARDNNTYDGPGMARSSVHFVTIGSPDQGPASGGGGGGGQEVNLMQLQRDLISATSGLPASASRSTLADLGASQYEIRGYAEKLLALLQSLGAPPDAITAMNAAIENMNQAEKNLNAGESVPAVDQEGQALANLYQVARLLSASMAPGQESSQLKILLEDLRKARQERQEQAQNEISAALAQTLALLNAQEALQQGASGKGEGKGQGAGNDPNGSPGQNNPELARQQQELADKARALAERLSRAAGNNPSLSHRVGEEAGSAADRMGAAAEGLRGGEPPDSPGVSAAQAQGVDALSHVAQSLDQLSKKTENNADVKEEGAPPEYSDQLSRYYQKLSHEK